MIIAVASSRVFVNGCFIGGTCSWCTGRWPRGNLRRSRIDNKWAYNILTNSYQAVAPNLFHQAFDMCRRLPILTGILASVAYTIGGFGLVGGAITNRYQSPDLGLGRPGATFTNHYRREQETHNWPEAPSWSHSEQGGSQWWQYNVGLEWWHTIRSGRHHHGRCRKDLSGKIFFGRIAFSEHGGKTGMAMIKYPLCKKNAQHPKHCVYRSGCVLSISVID